MLSRVDWIDYIAFLHNLLCYKFSFDTYFQPLFIIHFFFLPLHISPSFYFLPCFPLIYSFDPFSSHQFSLPSFAIIQIIFHFSHDFVLHFSPPPPSSFPTRWISISKTCHCHFLFPVTHIFPLLFPSCSYFSFLLTSFSSYVHVFLPFLY